jgi:hypothetical protein
MAYLQDPKNGASPTMQRLQPILASNIQEHSVMKYQEQMNGLTQQKLQQNVSPEQAQNPSVVQGAMAEAAQEILNANMAMGKQQSPEQQMVELEQKRVELEMQKLQLQAAKDNAQATLDAQELELKQTEMLLKTAQGKETQQIKVDKSEADRLSKQQIKALDLMSKLTSEENRVQIEADKIQSQEKIKALETLNSMSTNMKEES